MSIEYYRQYEPVFGQWKIVEEIGAGSFGEVYRIERQDFGHMYTAALKAISIPQNKSELEKIRDELPDEESVTTYFRSMVEDFVGEFAMMSGLKGHSNIVSYEDHQVIPHKDDVGWDILIRMELLTPFTKYAKSKALTYADVVRLGIDICKALELCQKKNIYHRDIKPSNIFVSEYGEFKLGDFGVARIGSRTGSKSGTEEYMAPEVYFGRHFDSTIDTYSLGLVMYRLLNNGNLPFVKVNSFSEAQEALKRRVSGELLPAPVNSYGELTGIILKACAPNPEDRFETPTQFRAALDSLPIDNSEIAGKSSARMKFSQNDEGTMSKQPEDIQSPVEDDEGHTVGKYSVNQREESGTKSKWDSPNKSTYFGNGKPAQKEKSRKVKTSILAAIAVAVLIIGFVLVKSAIKPKEPEPQPTPEPLPTIEPLPTEGYSTAGTWLTDIKYNADGQIQSLIEDETEWIYVYSDEGEFKYRMEFSEDVPALKSSSGRLIPDTDITYKILFEPVEECAGFSFDYRVCSFSNGSMDGDRWIYAASENHKDSAAWNVIGRFSYDVYSVDMKWHEVTAFFDEPQTFAAFGTPRVYSDNYSVFDNDHVLTGIWLADYNNVQLQSNTDTLGSQSIVISKDITALSSPVTAGKYNQMFIVNAKGNLNLNTSFEWQKFNDATRGWVTVVFTGTATSNEEYGLRIENSYDKATGTYVSILWANGITPSAAGTYRCVIKDATGIEKASSEAYVQVA